MTTASLDTIARLHKLTTAFHVYIYFAPDSAAEYAKEGIEGWSGYFGSRSAAMGPIPPEMVTATFYNFSPDVVNPAAEGMWDIATPEQFQLARWTAAASVIDATCADALTEAEIDEALSIASQAVAGLAWAGRPLAAGNHAVLAKLDASPFASHKLLRLWQLVTIIREWRGDAHIALLIAEPLTGAECTVVSNAMHGGFTKASRGWSEDEWNEAVANLTDRGWISDEETLTEQGKANRDELERRTDEWSAPIWGGIDDATVNRFGDLLQPLVDGIAEAGHLKPVGLRPKG